jgi:simple sugar transport system substrate-binding protein
MDMKRRWGPLLILGFAMVTAPAGVVAQSESDAPADSVKLGFVTKFPVDFFFTLENAAKTWDEAHPEAEVLFAGAVGHGRRRPTAIEDLVAQGVQGLAVTPTSPAVIPALDKAIAAGVPVVLMDNDLPDWTGKSSVVATDNLQGGLLAGEWLAGQLQPGDKLAILEGVPGVPALDARVDGMLQGLGDLASEVEIVKRLPTACAQDQGQTATEDILTGDPDVTAIYAACGPPAVGAPRRSPTRGCAPRTSSWWDSTRSRRVALIVAGSEDASVAQYPAKIGELGIDTLLKVVQGDTVEPFVDTGARW